MTSETQSTTDVINNCQQNESICISIRINCFPSCLHLKRLAASSWLQTAENWLWPNRLISCTDLRLYRKCREHADRLRVAVSILFLGRPQAALLWLSVFGGWSCSLTDAVRYIRRMSLRDFYSACIAGSCQVCVLPLGVRTSDTFLYSSPVTPQHAASFENQHLPQLSYRVGLMLFVRWLTVSCMVHECCKQLNNKSWTPHQTVTHCCCYSPTNNSFALTTSGTQDNGAQLSLTKTLGTNNY